MRKIFLAALASISLFSIGINQAYAGIEVSPILIDVTSNDIGKQDIRVYNTGDDTAYVKITPKLIQNPGTDHEKNLTMTDPAKLGLLVTPRLMVVPPGKMRLIRLVLTQPTAKADRLYRIEVQPTVGDLLVPKGQQNDLGIKVLIGYGVVVIQRPANIDVQMSAQRNGKQLTIKNTGNTNFVLASGKQCDNNQKNCQTLPVKRLYAGQTWQVTLPYDAPVQYQQSYLQEAKLVNIK